MAKKKTTKKDAIQVATKGNKKAAQQPANSSATTGTDGGNGVAGKTNGRLRVRMYRVGFGDFFLMTVPTKDNKELHVVIDCGVTKGKTGKGDIGTIKTAVKNMALETEGKLALIIMTHRHMDHIIGFSRCPEYKEFKDKVEAIWMPIWEKEYDEETDGKKKVSEVSKFQDELKALALGARRHLAASGADDDNAELVAMLENATGEEMRMGLAGTGGGTNAASLELLKHGLGVEPEYYAKGDKPKLPQSLLDAGLTAEVLGPPPTDEVDFMKLMDLKKQVAQYLDVASREEDGQNHFRPFRLAFEFKPEENPEFVGKSMNEWWRHDGSPHSAPWKRFEELVKASQPAALLTAVKNLDNFLNNQSLVVLFTFRGKKLLFAGDAQGGNWEYWLYDGDAPTKTPSAKLGKTGAEVLANLDFYKVGHHGSTNATPIAAVTAMNNGIVAMCSTQPDSFGSEGNNSEVPRIPLMNALGAKTTLVRSDQITVKVEDGDPVPPSPGAPANLKQPRAGKLEPGPCYLDYFL